jgi:hypothetical protein
MMTDQQRQRLEQRYQHLFERFNRKFFADRLPQYRIIVHFPSYVVDGVPVAGECHKKYHRIDLTAAPLPAGEGLLIHEMAHAASNVHHVRRFRAEITRLYKAGAPLMAADVNEYVD